MAQSKGSLDQISNTHSKMQFIRRDTKRTLLGIIKYKKSHILTQCEWDSPCTESTWNQIHFKLSRRRLKIISNIQVYETHTKIEQYSRNFYGLNYCKKLKRNSHAGVLLLLMTTKPKNHVLVLFEWIMYTKDWFNQYTPTVFRESIRFSHRSPLKYVRKNLDVKQKGYKIFFLYISQNAFLT